MESKPFDIKRLFIIFAIMSVIFSIIISFIIVNVVGVTKGKQVAELAQIRSEMTVLSDNLTQIMNDFISPLEMNIDDIQIQINTIQSSFGDLKLINDTDRDNINNTLTQANSNIDNATKRLNVISSLVTDLQTTLQSELDNLDNNNTILQSSVTTLQSQYTTLTSAITTLQSQYTTLATQVATLTAQFASMGNIYGDIYNVNNLNYASDGNLTTYASVTGIPSGATTGYIQVDFTTPILAGVDIYIYYCVRSTNPSNNYLCIDLYYNGNWHNAYTGVAAGTASGDFQPVWMKVGNGGVYAVSGMRMVYYQGTPQGGGCLYFVEIGIGNYTTYLH